MMTALLPKYTSRTWNLESINAKQESLQLTVTLVNSTDSLIFLEIDSNLFKDVCTNVSVLKLTLERKS